MCAAATAFLSQGNGAKETHLNDDSFWIIKENPRGGKTIG